MNNTYPKGSKWRKWDLHIHTPASIKKALGFGARGKLAYPIRRQVIFGSHYLLIYTQKNDIIITGLTVDFQ
jgi:hypothetical protein